MTEVYVLTWADWTNRASADAAESVEGVFASLELAQRHALWTNAYPEETPTDIEWKQTDERTHTGGAPDSDVVWTIVKHELTTA